MTTLPELMWWICGVVTGACGVLWLAWAASAGDDDGPP